MSTHDALTVIAVAVVAIAICDIVNLIRSL